MTLQHKVYSIFPKIGRQFTQYNDSLRKNPLKWKQR